MSSRESWPAPGLTVRRRGLDPPGEPADGRPGVLDPEALVAQRAEAFAKAARRARRGDEAKAIHDVRVASRRLLAALRHRRDLRGLAPGPEADRRLRRLRRKLGPVREREVALTVLERAMVQQPARVQEALAAFIARLRRRVERARRASRRVVTRARVGRALEDAARERGGAESGIGPALGLTAVGRRLALLETAAREWIARVADTHQEAAVHPARLAIKKWRYALECAAESGDTVAAASLKAAQDLQHGAGVVHDLATAQAFLERRERRWRSRDRVELAESAALLREALASERARALAAFVAQASSASETLPRRASS